MSALADLLVELDAVVSEADRHAARLAEQARHLDRAAATAMEATRGTEQADGRSVAAQLVEASRATLQAARHLDRAARAGRQFVARHATGGSPHVPSTAGHAAPTDGRSPIDRPHPPSGGRYVRPSADQQAALERMVAVSGPHGIGNWIGATNPNYATGDETWVANCGPCARAVADTYQGLGVHAAAGDGDRPPGEGPEMWAAVDVVQRSSLSNTDPTVSPERFSASAYASLADRLRAEGPGAVAIVGVDWDDPRVPTGEAGGHWFNAYVDDQGVVRWADGQVGVTGGWPPGYDVPISRMEAVVRPAGRQPWKEVVL